jgi:hypothetical protein
VRALAAAALLLAAPNAARETAMQHATGTFEVKITPQDSHAGTDGALPTARMALAKTFSGDLTGTAAGTMLSIGTPKPGQAAAYVALDQVTGTLAGKRGGFVLVHRGTMSKAGGGDLDIEIAPDSGTGELTGIAGTLAIEVKAGVHHYDLAYTLPR